MRCAAERQPALQVERNDAAVHISTQIVVWKTDVLR
jgi:hypothetical protein